MSMISFLRYLFLVSFVIRSYESENLPLSHFHDLSNSLFPTSEPSTEPSIEPSISPSTILPSLNPVVPSFRPTKSPVSKRPSQDPSSRPTVVPSVAPSLPTRSPTCRPTKRPSVEPSSLPSVVPTTIPSGEPTWEPSIAPSAIPTTIAPSAEPSIVPSAEPTYIPSIAPSARPTIEPSILPSAVPSSIPSQGPTSAPSTVSPSNVPTITPSFAPTSFPSSKPTWGPTISLFPTAYNSSSAAASSSSTSASQLSSKVSMYTSTASRAAIYVAPISLFFLLLTLGYVIYVNTKYQYGIGHGWTRFRRSLANSLTTSWLFATESAIKRTGYQRSSRAFVAYYSITASILVTVITTQAGPLSAEAGSSAGLIIAYFANVFLHFLLSISIGIQLLKDALSSPPPLNTLSKNVDETISKADDLYYNFKPHPTADVLLGNEKSIYSIIATYLVFTALSGGMWYTIYYFMKPNFSISSLVYVIVLNVVLITLQLVANYFQSEIVMRYSFTSLYNKIICDGCDYADEMNPKEEVTRPTLVAVISHDSENTIKSARKVYRPELRWDSDRLEQINKRWQEEKPKNTEISSAATQENPMYKKKKPAGLDRSHASNVPSGSLGVFNLLSGTRDSSNSEFD